MKYEASKQPHPACGYRVEPTSKDGLKYFYVSVHQVQSNAGGGWSIIRQNDETEAMAHRLAAAMNGEQ